MDIRKLVHQMRTNLYLLELRRDQWKSQQQLQNKQFKRLKSIIKHAYDFVPYYRHLFLHSGIKPDDIKNYDDLTKIPLTSKKDLQENYLDLITKGIDASKLPWYRTSGSSGTPIKIFDDYQTASLRAGSGNYLFLECGVKLNDKFVTVWGRDAKEISWGKKYVRFIGGIGETTVPLFSPEKIANILQRIKPDILLTFPSVLYTLANFDVSGVKPRLIFTQGETVTQHCRNLVRKAFDSTLFETYGSVEFGNLGFECTEHSGLHTITNDCCIEFIDEKGEHAPAGESGEIIVTGLNNYTMPLIRYRIGDEGKSTDEKCPCGRSWPIIKHIQGRINDYLVLPSGKKISWLYIVRLLLLDREFKNNVFSVSQYQFLQERENRVILRIVKGRDFTDPEMPNRIKTNLESYFSEIGEGMEIDVQVVTDIPQGRTGKRKVFVSML